MRILRKYKKNFKIILVDANWKPMLLKSNDGNAK